LLIYGFFNISVALPRRAWIEIQIIVYVGWWRVVALPRRAWIEICIISRLGLGYSVALPRRAWIEIAMKKVLKWIGIGRSPQESVD